MIASKRHPCLGSDSWLQEPLFSQVRTPFPRIRDPHTIRTIGGSGLNVTPCSMSSAAMRCSRFWMGPRRARYALDKRVVIEQAKGVIAQRLGLDIDQSFSALRTYSRNHNLRLVNAAAGIINRSIEPGSLRAG